MTEQDYSKLVEASWYAAEKLLWCFNTLVWLCIGLAGFSAMAYALSVVCFLHVVRMDFSSKPELLR